MHAQKKKQLISLLAQPTASLQIPICERLRPRNDKGTHIVHWLPYLVQTKHIAWSTIVVILFSDLKMQSQPMSYKHDAFRATVAQEIELVVLWPKGQRFETLPVRQDIFPTLHQTNVS